MSKITKASVANFVKAAQKSLKKHSPEILIGTGVAGLFTTTFLAVKGTPAALKLIEQRKEELEVDKLTVAETVKTTWKCYIPAAVTGVASTACIVGGCSVNARRAAALTTAYKISETALAEYREKVIETVGEKQEKVIRDKVSEEQIKKNPVSKSEVYITERGNTLCYDSFSGRYFKCDIDQIRKAVNIINRALLVDNYVSLNDFYDEIDLDNTKMGNELGWSIDQGLLEVYFSSQLTENDEPCVVLNYSVVPRYGYDEFY